MRVAARGRRARRRVRSRRAPAASAILGVDVGGTTTAVGLVTRDGEVVVDASAATQAASRDPVETVVALIAEVTRKARKSARAISAVGVGVPGPVDADRGIVGEPVTHVPELAGRALAAELGDRVGLPVFVDNDVNALALGEATLGIARGARSRRWSASASSSRRASSRTTWRSPTRRRATRSSTARKTGPSR